MNISDKIIYPISDKKRIVYQYGHYYPQWKWLFLWFEYNSSAHDATVWLPTLKDAIEWIDNA